MCLFNLTYLNLVCLVYVSWGIIFYFPALSLQWLAKEQAQSRGTMSQLLVHELLGGPHSTPPPGSIMSGIILFGRPQGIILGMFPEKNLGCNIHFGHFPKLPPTIFVKVNTLVIGHNFTSGWHRNKILVSIPRLLRSTNAMESSLKWLD